MILSKKLRNFFIFGVCSVRFFVSGRAKKIPRKINSIVFIQMAHLGDMVCTTPLFRAIKSARPQARVIVVSNRPSLEVLQDNHDIDERIIKTDLWSLVRQIRSRRPDYGCLVGPDFFGLAVLYLAGIKAISAPDVRQGVSTGSTRFYNLLKKFVITTPYYEGHYFARQYLRLLEPIGIVAEDTTKHLGFSESARTTINQFLADRNIVKGQNLLIGFSSSAGNKIKVWPASNFAKVADYLFQKYRAKLFLLGGPMDKEEAARTIANLDPHTEVTNCSELFTIDELKALTSNLDLFISTDTGPIYIAEAFGVPTVDIVGPIDEREQPPIGPKHKIVSLHTDTVRPELSILNARIFNYQEARRQVEEITPEMVIEKVEEIIKQL